MRRTQSLDVVAMMSMLTRGLKGVADGYPIPVLVLLWLALLTMAVSHIVQIWTLFIPSGQFKALHVGLALIIVYLLASQNTQSRLKRILSYALAVASFICMMYVLANFDQLINERLFGPSQTDVVIAVTLLVCTVYAVTGVYGWIIPVIVVVGLFYGYFGYLFESDLLYHSGIRFKRLISYTSIPYFEGILGAMTGLSASMVFIFMIFAGLLKSTGGIDFIVGMATHLSGKSRGGPAQIAVIGSGLMGMISGSSVANVASTGAITIPLMKKSGFPGHYAGGVEAVASTGGQFVPPVMGLTAFLIVAITGVSYNQVMLAAFLPALIYYGNLLVVVRMKALALGLEVGHDPGSEDALTIWDDLKQYAHLVVAIILLIYLMVTRIPPAHAAVSAAAFIVTADILKQLLTHRRSLKAGLRKAAANLLNGLRDGVQSGAQLGVTIAVIGIFVDIMTTTGFAQKVSHLMLGISDSNLWMLLVLAAGSSLIFGLGMPTPAAYTLVAILAAPALVDFGINILAAHMFVFFFANMSAITPPVALSSLVASKLAKAAYLKTALTATQLGIPGFALPFLFILYPELLMLEGSLQDRTVIFASVLAGFVLLNIAIGGALFQPGLAPWKRVLFLAGAVLLFVPMLPAKLLAIALAAALIYTEYATYRALGPANRSVTSVSKTK